MIDLYTGAAMTNNSQKAYKLGQSMWYDNIQRRLLENGEMAGMIERGEIYGMTSNPSIFNNAIAKSSDYDDQLLPLAKKGESAESIYETLAVADIRHATDLFSPLYKSTNGGDGFVSLEVDPDLARQTEATISEAARLWKLVDRPNLMVKIPATKEGLPAIKKSIAAGLNINVTLIFSLERYKEVMEAYLSGLEQRLTEGKPLDHVTSVASFFVSRIDTKIDGWLDEIIARGGEKAKTAEGTKGKIALASAKLAYQEFKQVFGSPRFKALAEKGARLQRPLWASTSTKNPAYSDVLYVDELIGQDTVNTLPPKTLTAFNDHGKVALTLEQGLDEMMKAVSDLAGLGLSMDQATQELEDEGVAAFSKAFASLMETVETRRKETA
jgi:transaldolase